MGYKEIKEGIATVVGGAATATPNWFSGAGGVAGVVGCWSVSQGQISDGPIGIVLPGPFQSPVGVQGEKETTDTLELLLLVARNDNESAWAALDPFHDLIRDAFDTHMTLTGAVNVQAAVIDGTPGVITWGGIDYVAWKFTVHVIQVLHPTYAT